MPRDIIRISQQLPYADMKANTYCLPGNPPVLIDSGFHLEERITELESKLDEAGIEPGEVAHVFLTHGHTDHAGGAGHFSKKYGARIWIHPADAHLVDGRQSEFFRARLPVVLAKMGADADFLEAFGKVMEYPAQAYHLQAMEDAAFYRDDMVLPDVSRRLRVIHTPGHSPGSVCLFEEQNGALFSGDTLLPLGPPRTLIASTGPDSETFSGLTDLENSLKQMERLDPKIVFPGHGKPALFPDLIKRAWANVEKRRRKLLKILKPGQSVFQMLRDGRPAGLGQGVRILMRLAETRAVLEALLREGLVAMDDSDGVERFFPVEGSEPGETAQKNDLDDE